jgi:hypothetical protein
VVFIQTASAPVILQVGFGFTVTVFMQVDVQLLASDITRVSVKLPGAPAVTVTFWVPAPPDIVPLPEMVHEYEFIPAGAVNTFPVLLVQTALAPVMEQVGLGLMVTVFIQVEIHPFGAVIVEVSVKLPEAPAVTVTF